LIVENEYFQSAVQLATAATQETIAAYRILALMGALQVPLPSDAPVCPEHWDLLSRALVFPEVAKLLATTAFAPEGQAPAAGVAVDGETAGDNGAEKPASAGSASTPLGKGEAGFSGVPDAKAISAGAVAPTRRGYPFSLLLGSYGDMAQARRAVETDGKGEMVRYWVKVDLGADGIRYRVFGGYFATAAAAQKAAFKHRLNPLAVKATRYAVQIGAAGDRHKADANVEILRQKGFSPYVVALDENVYATYLGAFYTEKGANDLLAELGPLPMDCRVVER
jgi:cell division septation protein DedD